MTDERDDLMERVRATLREPPTVDPSARARVLVAVAAERERATAQSYARRHTARRTAAATGVVAAALLIGWLVWPAPGVHRTDVRRAAMAPTSSQGAPAHATLAVNAPAGSALQSVQLVFRDPTAHRVSVVGDFTEWDARQAPMTQDSASGLWSITLALRPGRHVYAFLVDDTVWVQDPRAMEAPDADFGRPGSVLLVGQP